MKMSIFPIGYTLTRPIHTTAFSVHGRCHSAQRCFFKKIDWTVIQTDCTQVESPTLAEVILHLCLSLWGHQGEDRQQWGEKAWIRVVVGFLFWPLGVLRRLASSGTFIYSHFSPFLQEALGGVHSFPLFCLLRWGRLGSESMTDPRWVSWGARIWTWFSPASTKHWLTRSF